jgi:23S rRNA (adenine2030-N6)-methyltransferase
MLSYQHAYHAGGPADLHKHMVLAGLLALLTQKPRPISYLESHAGRGLYDLSTAASLKTGEAMRGVALLQPGAHPFWQAVAAVRASHGPTAYPGSPAVARALLRPGDAMTLMELHPAEHAALAAAFGRSAAPGPSVAVHRRDGAEGLRALTPPEPRRGLALIDPSYEVKTEYLDTALLALEVASRWPEGVIVVWYPLLSQPRHDALLGPVEAVNPAGTLRDEVLFADPPARGMVGSGLLVLNAPYGAEAVLAQAREAARPVFAEAGARRVA